VANRLTEYEQGSRTGAEANWPADMQSPDWQSQANKLMQQASQWVAEHPEIALTTAVVTGVVLGWLIKRR